MKKKFFCLLLFMILILDFLYSKPIYANSLISNSVSANTLDDCLSDSNDLSICADSCILMDKLSNKILYEKNSYNKMYPASTTKVMTAILVCEKCSLTDIVNVSYYAVHSVPNSYSTANLKPGEQLSIKDLLHALLISSANESAFALAEYIANNGNNYSLDASSASKESFNKSIESFSAMMNSKAKEIGCLSTNFVNPNGIQNENHYSTAYDLALIGKYAINNVTIMDIVSKLSYDLPNTSVYSDTIRHLSATNLLLKKSRSGYYEYATGLKTGYTDSADYCIIATAKKDNRDLIAVVLHSDNTTNADTSRESDCKKLFEYGFNNYSYRSLANSNSVATTLNIINGSKDTRSLNILVKNDVATIVKVGNVLDVTPNIKITKYLAPIAKGEVVGTITYTAYGNTFTSDLVAEHDVYSVSYLSFILIILFVFMILLFLVTLINIKEKMKKSKK